MPTVNFNKAMKGSAIAYARLMTIKAIIRRLKMVPLARIELTRPVPETGALSTELQGHFFR